MAHAQRCYPYTDHLQYLEDQSESTWSQDDNNRDLNDREILLISIGDIMLHGDRKDRKTLAQSLYKFTREQILRGATTTSNSPQGFASFRHHGGYENMPGNGTVSRPSLARFAIALKERGDEIGILPDYTTRSIHDYPPKFETMIKFCGETFTGCGPSKKQSRHEAARIACSSMHIDAGANAS
nr:hypothetical protein CFP56_39022 [Quercus suber]